MATSAWACASERQAPTSRSSRCPWWSLGPFASRLPMVAIRRRGYAMRRPATRSAWTTIRWLAEPLGWQAKSVTIGLPRSYEIQMSSGVTMNVLGDLVHHVEAGSVLEVDQVTEFEAVQRPERPRMGGAMSGEDDVSIASGRRRSRPVRDALIDHRERDPRPDRLVNVDRRDLESRDHDPRLLTSASRWAAGSVLGSHSAAPHRWTVSALRRQGHRTRAAARPERGYETHCGSQQVSCMSTSADSRLP